MAKDVMKHNQELAGQVILDDQFVSFVGNAYDIPLNRCDTPEKILGWIRILSGKSWITVDMIDLFIARACDGNGIQYLVDV